MRSELFHMEYYETYYFTNIVHNVMKDPTPYLRGLDGFFGDLNYKRFLAPFPRFSALHGYIEFIISNTLFEEFAGVELDNKTKQPHAKLWVNVALAKHGIAHEPFANWLAKNNLAREDACEDDIGDYYRELYDEGPLEAFLERMIDEVFFLLFFNRAFLIALHQMIANEISEVDCVEPDEERWFRKPGGLKRSRIPTWARRAVFYRDRGACAVCHRDISNLVSLRSEKHLDHIVPLARGGINDVTNLQLLCSGCNQAKKDGDPKTSSRYERWY